MNITIIGAGNMATAIGFRLVDGGHSVLIYDRNLSKAEGLAQKLNKGNGSVVGKELDGSLQGDILILALPYSAIFEVVEKYKKELSGKIIIDISNPVDPQTFELIPPSNSSGAEEIAKILPDDSKLIKAFNTTFSGPLTQGEIEGKPLDVFIAGDDQESKNMVNKFITDSGLRGLDVGPLKMARHLEGLQLVHLSLQEKMATSWMSAIKVLP